MRGTLRCRTTGRAVDLHYGWRADGGTGLEDTSLGLMAALIANASGGLVALGTGRLLVGDQVYECSRFKEWTDTLIQDVATPVPVATLPSGQKLNGFVAVFLPD